MKLIILLQFTHGFLIEQEYQLKQARTTKDIDRIEEKIEQILIEVRFLQSNSKKN